MSSIRFSPNLNQAHRIEWLPWARSTFDRAQSEDKPVLLSITASWCYWCHVMDETTYSDPDVQSLLANNFIAVRIDNDHRPDINARYNVGGWPTTAFLTPHGGLIGGATYLPPDQFLAMMVELQDAYRADKPRLYEQSRDLLHQRREHARRVSAGPEIESYLTDRVSRIVAGSYDSAHGGFGSDPKFTNPPILRFLLHLYRTTGEEFYSAMICKSLDTMAGSPMLDDVDGGFFRYSATGDWSEPQREKLLEDNIQLARAYLDASILLGNDQSERSSRYREVAESTFSFAMDHLYDTEVRGFHGSVGAHSEFFTLGPEQRASASPPPRDPSCYTSLDSLAATIALDASWKLGGGLGDRLGRIGREVLDSLVAQATGDSLSKVRSNGEADNTPALMTDWAHLLAGLMQAHATTSEARYLDAAVGIASTLVDRFFDEAGGGFFDIEADEDAMGHMQVREKQLPENMTAVQGMLRLYQATRNDDYRQICEATLSSFAGVFREYGEYSAEFGLAVDLFSNPMVEVTIEGSPEDAGCGDLIAAAVRLDSPNLEIKTVAAGAPALAHVCLDTLCLPPVSTPEALRETVAGVNDQPSSPFQDILRIFPGD